MSGPDYFEKGPGMFGPPIHKGSSIREVLFYIAKLFLLAFVIGYTLFVFDINGMRGEPFLAVIGAGMCIIAFAFAVFVMILFLMFLSS